MDCSIVSMFMQVYSRASTSTTDIPPVLTKINLVCRLLLRLGTFRHTGGGHHFEGNTADREKRKRSSRHCSGIRAHPFLQRCVYLSLPEVNHAAWGLKDLFSVMGVLVKAGLRFFSVQQF